MDSKRYDTKQFCCSNSARTEAKVLGILDFILHLLYLLISVWVSDLVTYHTEYLKRLTAAAADANSTNLYFDEGLFTEIETHQCIYLTAMATYSVYGMFMGVVLFHAARVKKPPLLKLWFLLTILTTTITSPVVIILIVMKVDRVLPPIGLFLLAFLYTLYELWIVVKLLREIKQGFGMDGGNNEPPKVVVLSPSISK